MKTIRIVLDFPLHGGKQETALFELARLCLAARKCLSGIGEFSALRSTFVEQLLRRMQALRCAPQGFFALFDAHFLRRARGTCAGKLLVLRQESAVSRQLFPARRLFLDFPPNACQRFALFRERCPPPKELGFFLPVKARALLRGLRSHDCRRELRNLLIFCLSKRRGLVLFQFERRKRSGQKRQQFLCRALSAQHGLPKRFRLAFQLQTLQVVPPLLFEQLIFPLIGVALGF